MTNMNINQLRPLTGSGRKLYIETYGCQMNVGDSEIVVSIMQQEGFRYTETLDEADIVLINTCSIRDNAEQRIWGRLSEMRHMRKKKLVDGDKWSIIRRRQTLEQMVADECLPE